MEVQGVAEGSLELKVRVCLVLHFQVEEREDALARMWTRIKIACGMNCWLALEGQETT